MALITTTIQADECNYGFSGNAVDHKDDPTMIVDADKVVNGDETSAFVTFDISALPVGTTLVEAKLKLYMEAKSSVVDDSIGIDAYRSDAYPIPFDQYGTASYVQLVANGLCGAAEGWKEFDLSMSGLETALDADRRLTFKLNPTRYKGPSGTEKRDSRVFRTDHYGDGSFAPQLILKHDEALPIGMAKLEDGGSKPYKVYDPAEVAGNQLRIKTPAEIGCLPLGVASAETPLRIQTAAGLKGIQPYREKRSETIQKLEDHEFSGSWGSNVSLGGYSVAPFYLESVIVGCTTLRAIVEFISISSSMNWTMWVHTQGGSWQAVGSVKNVSQTGKPYAFDATFSERDVDAIVCSPNTSQGSKSWNNYLIPFGQKKSYTAEYEF